MLQRNIIDVNKGAIVYSLLRDIPMTIDKGGYHVEFRYGGRFTMSISPNANLNTIVCKDEPILSVAQFKYMDKNYLERFGKLAEYYNYVYNSLIEGYGDLMKIGDLTIVERHHFIIGGETISENYNGKLVLLALLILPQH